MRIIHQGRESHTMSILLETKLRRKHTIFKYNIWRKKHDYILDFLGPPINHGFSLDKMVLDFALRIAEILSDDI